ncbi:phosphoribosylglycinamide formyltransferase [Synechocystis sp. PCC 6803]|uniref:Formyltetrahydrofolate deformylase n=1 Tax=Synechocystis sp. (strain ATCC 27184 / PCC 6803 / Kazusa) TaxID=1111708 RepID=PURU_SYNY3|nr:MULTISPECIES: formyltetrahydrofolate deformylase [unclassified Synechocystis]Q55135.1 RecName: Full=Formyltetrahydrofolate deformylase; AltName: Full=Formyl-FH(4) hydrolase [Synechocystis sp. PCC 6803 substr. Kazusa]AGF52562.1 phosphoribosylglycinamide formyltransferase [Synechocystis sp. PCC 6803]ALJ68487.1 formyltetrahydrofolate deformylase [Synechocystis sp. PCC 6803]AVP90330.1 formyltetrahydrofolate deformylase [Synechocystis sp. IPPAS B-1465]MBD2616934.1 formyltetrahydrofolate deformyl
MQNLTATLLVSCPDQPGIVAQIAQFIYQNQGNIIHADQHTDFSSGLFLNRVEWQLDNFRLSRPELLSAWSQLAEQLQATWQIHFSDQLPRLALWVSKQDHCLLDILWRWRSGELRCEIPLIISNHPDLKSIADQFGIDFHCLPITKENKLAQETAELALLKQYQIDLVVLAKYLQILTTDFVVQFPNIINIHHSFLPAFPGANPYHRAHERGVKIIGATAHYATAQLDEGPIIEQDVVRVSHRDNVDDLIRKGRDLERVVLARAVRLHLQHRILVYDNRTVVFA